VRAASLRGFVALFLALAACAAGAQTVTLQGTLGSKALVIVDGAPPRSLAAGESFKGVKILSILGDQAVVEVDGKRQTLRVGDAPASVGGGGAGANGNRITISASSGGHFMSQGAINGRAVQFMVDTGATSVAIGMREAERLGIDHRKGTPGLGNTANGTVQMWRVKLASVRIGDVEVYDVDATIVPAAMPYVLLGNSFLTRFQMKRENDMLVLERRY
jgi:aspartyl protease family protein